MIMFLMNQQNTLEIVENQQATADQLKKVAWAINADKTSLKTLILFVKQIYDDLIPTVIALHNHLNNFN